MNFLFSFSRFIPSTVFFLSVYFLLFSLFTPDFSLPIYFSLLFSCLLYFSFCFNFPLLFILLTRTHASFFQVMHGGLNYFWYAFVFVKQEIRQNGTLIFPSFINTLICLRFFLDDLWRFKKKSLIFIVFFINYQRGVCKRKIYLRISALLFLVFP